MLLIGGNAFGELLLLPVEGRQFGLVNVLLRGAGLRDLALLLFVPALLQQLRVLVGGEEREVM